MKKMKLLAFAIISFLCFGLINVEAETITKVEDLQTFFGKDNVNFGKPNFTSCT